MRTLALAAALLLSSLCACVHNDVVTLGVSRTIADAETPWGTKWSYGLTLPVEFVLSPITGYVDAIRNPPVTDGRVYLSYIATRTLVDTEMNMWHHWVSLPLPLFVDTALLPIMGIIDGIKILLASDG